MPAARRRIADVWTLEIPAAIRRELGFDLGDELVLTVDARTVQIQRLSDSIQEVQAAVGQSAGDRSLVDELIAERREEAAGE